MLVRPINGERHDQFGAVNLSAAALGIDAGDQFVIFQPGQRLQGVVAGPLAHLWQVLLTLQQIEATSDPVTGHCRVAVSPPPVRTIAII